MKHPNPIELWTAKYNVRVAEPYLTLWKAMIAAHSSTTPTEATGALPLTFRSNGTALLDYRIYGNTLETTVKTANIVPLTTQKTATANGITVTIDSSGVWHVTGTATSNATILFDLEEAFTVPVALDYGGEGVIQFFNSVAMDDGSGNETARVLFYYGGVQQDYMGLHIQNRSITQYSDLANKGVNRLGIWVEQGITCDFTLAPMVVDDGIAHDEYILPETTEVQGVGVRTENLFDPNAAEENGDKIISDFMPLDPSGQYITIAFDIEPRTFYNYEITYYDSTKTAISFMGGMGEAYKTREAVKLNWQSEAQNAAYVRVTLPKDLTNVLIQNGSTSGEFIPYGYKMQMVSRTENLYNVEDDTANYYLLSSSGWITTIQSSQNFVSGKIPVTPGKNYTLSNAVTTFGTILGCAFYDATDTRLDLHDISRIAQSYTFTAPDNAAYFRTSIKRDPDIESRTTFTEGSTVPTSYIPYHRTETPIYIGNTQLMQDEFVSYGKQAIYKRTENLFDKENAISGEYWINDSKPAFTYHAGSLCYFIPIFANTTYTVSCKLPEPDSGTFAFRVGLTNSIPTHASGDGGAAYNRMRINKQVSDVVSATLTNTNYKYLCWQVTTAYSTFDPMLVEGSTAPDSYIPYLESTTPPVPLPELPTFSDTSTVLDYEETPAPEEVWVKYSPGRSD